MKPLLITLFLFLFFQAQSVSAQTGDPEAGERHYRGKFCYFCHGDNGEGGFGPDLAGGRGLTLDQFRRAIREPWGVMGNYTEQQLPDDRIVDIYAFVKSKTPVQAPGEWHWAKAPSSAHEGQQIYMQTAGCGQCHEPENGYGRMWLGEYAKNVDFDYFAKQIYDHTDKWPSGGMPNFSRERLPEAALREVYQWMVLDIGLRASMGARMSYGEQEDDQITVNVQVRNRGIKDLGLDVSGITLFIKVPDGRTVTGGTGTGYMGVQPLATLGLEPRLRMAPHSHDDTGHVERPEQDLSGDVVVWKIPKMIAASTEELSFVLSGPTPTSEMANEFAGSTLHWENPGRNANGSPPIMVYRDLRLPDTGDHELVSLPTATFNELGISSENEIESTD